MDEKTRARVRQWLDSADEYLRAAEHELNGGFYARSVSTSYYAMFYAATAALESIGIERSKHSGVVSAFGEHFVRSGKISGEFGHTFHKMMEQREASDYDKLRVFDRNIAEERLEEARQFVDAVGQYLAEKGLSSDTA